MGDRQDGIRNQSTGSNNLMFVQNKAVESSKMRAAHKCGMLEVELDPLLLFLETNWSYKGQQWKVNSASVKTGFEVSPTNMLGNKLWVTL